MHDNVCTNSGDAFGTALMDCFHGTETHYIVEREDGFADPSTLSPYFADYPEWGQAEKRMHEFVRGRVLDVGCGAGRHTLYLQRLGFEVVGIDKSPLAIEVAKQRGVKNACVVSLDELVVDGAPDLGTFGSVIMMGNNIGLLHSFTEGRNTLKRLANVTSSDARIIGTTRTPGETNNPDHLAYQKWNRERGRMPGQIRFRIRHRRLAGDWMDYLILSREELEQLVEGTGWRLEATIDGDSEFGGRSYLAVLCKE